MRTMEKDDSIELLSSSDATRASDPPIAPRPAALQGRGTAPGRARLVAGGTEGVEIEVLGEVSRDALCGLIDFSAQTVYRDEVREVHLQATK